MNTKFTYCLLTYTHSQLLEERVNVGILFHFESGKIIFKYPKSFKRIKELYNNFEEWQLKNNLSAIQDKLNRVSFSNYSLFIDESNKKEVKDELLLIDSTALQFSELKTGYSESESIEVIADNYYHLYFSHFNYRSKSF